MSIRLRLALAVAVACALLTPVSGVGAQSDLDAFMQKVLASRDENWKKLQQYILDERERVEVRGPSQVPLWGEQTDYTWFIRDGYFVRSPVKANGVEISDADRRKAEEIYLRRARERERRAEQAARGERAAGETGAAPDPAADANRAEPGPQELDALLRQSRAPGFINSAYFLRFKFEQGKYALVGRETFEDRDVLRIEYYPARLFSNDRDEQRKRADQQKRTRDKEVEDTLQRMMNKVSLVTIWVEPTSHQIVKYTFDNVNFDFLPAAWLVRINDLKASMTMSQPFPNVWLPRDVEMYFGAMLAIGPFNVRYRLDYHDYRQAKTSGRIIGIGGGE